MNYPVCHEHPSRKVEIVCLTEGAKCYELDCPERLTLQCTMCVNSSKCKKHNWKVVQGFIEEVFEVCETEEAKFEKKAKPKSVETVNKSR
jgi:hypothetical protein